jgi:hypothetical protein
MANVIAEKANKALLEFKIFGKELVHSPAAIIRGIGNFLGTNIPLYAMAHDTLGSGHTLLYSALSVYSVGIGCYSSWRHLRYYKQDKEKNNFDIAGKFLGTALSVTAGLCASAFLYNAMQPNDIEITNSVLKMINDNATELAVGSLGISAFQAFPEIFLSQLADYYREEQPNKHQPV